MPRRGLGRVGFLDQHVVVKKLRGAGAHDSGGEFGGIGFSDESVKFRDSFPVAIVIPEAAGFVSAYIFGEVGAGFVVVAFDPGAQAFDPVAESAAQTNGTLFGIGSAGGFVYLFKSFVHGLAGCRNGHLCIVINATPAIARHPPAAILTVSDSPRKKMPPITEVTGNSSKNGITWLTL